MLTVLDLFSGIGGISLGLERTGGFRTVMFCEIEPFPRLVLKKHWPEVPIHEDVRTLSAATLGGLRPDVICGGFPCQDISVAGKGAGLDGHRSGLWFEYARLVGELRPTWVVAENVGALRTRGVDRVCSDLEAEGYTVWPLLVGAWAVGAPHKRERVWIVAHRKELHGHAGDSKPRREIPQSRDHRSAGGIVSASRYDADGRGERPVGDRLIAGLERHWADSGQGRSRDEASGSTTETSLFPCWVRCPCCEDFWCERHELHAFECECPSIEEWAEAGVDPYREVPRWPARPGEPQHEWEEPRLAHITAGRRDAQPLRSPGASKGDCSAHADGTGAEGAGGWKWSPELPLGRAVDGLPSRLVRLARRANRESLKAYGNSVVPQVVEAIGYAILQAEEELR